MIRGKMIRGKMIGAKRSDAGEWCTALPDRGFPNPRTRSVVFGGRAGKPAVLLAAFSTPLR